VVPRAHRPQVSADNPFSEAQFKTLKYRPDLPARFGASAFGLMTPHDIHDGLAPGKWQQRAELLRAAYHAHPERFPRGVPVRPPLLTAAWINKPPAAPALAAPERIDP